MFLENLFNRKKLDSDIEDSLTELQRQLKQGGGYPWNKARLRGVLQDIAQGNFFNASKVDLRFEHVFTTEPLVIPEFNLDVFKKQSNKKFVGWGSLNDGWVSERCWQPTNPLLPGSKKQIALYLLTKEMSIEDCVKFVLFMGGTLPNAQGLVLSLQLIGERLPKMCTLYNGVTSGSYILGVDKKESCQATERSKGSNVYDVMTLHYLKESGEAYPAGFTNGFACDVRGYGNEYLLFYYDCD